MSRMFWGNRNDRRARPKLDSAGYRADASELAGELAAEPEADDSLDFELHVCCVCGALLGFDREDEINGEGPGRDICGPCNRTKNDEAMMGW